MAVVHASGGGLLRSSAHGRRLDQGGTAIFGQTEFGVRFVGMASAIAASYFLYRASLSLFREPVAAALCAIWLNATLLCNAAAIVATPDAPLAFFATLALFFLAKLLGRGAASGGLPSAPLSVSPS